MKVLMMAPMMVSNLEKSTVPKMVLTKEQHLAPMTVLLMELQMVPNLEKSTVPMMAPMMVPMKEMHWASNLAMLMAILKVLMTAMLKEKS